LCFAAADKYGKRSFSAPHHTNGLSSTSEVSGMLDFACSDLPGRGQFLIIIGKSKSSLHGLTSSDFSPTTDTWQ